MEILQSLKKSVQNEVSCVVLYVILGFEFKNNSNEDRYRKKSISESLYVSIVG